MFNYGFLEKAFKGQSKGLNSCEFLVNYGSHFDERLQAYIVDCRGLILYSIYIIRKYFLLLSCCLPPTLLLPNDKSDFEIRVAASSTELLLF